MSNMLQRQLYHSRAPIKRTHGIVRRYSTRCAFNHPLHAPRVIFGTQQLEDFHTSVQQMGWDSERVIIWPTTTTTREYQAASLEIYEPSVTREHKCTREEYSEITHCANSLRPLRSILPLFLLPGAPKYERKGIQTMMVMMSARVTLERFFF